MVTFQTLEKAILFSVNAHKGQKRKGDGRPYIFHPIIVANILYDVKESKNIHLMATATVLHDTWEDCEDVTIEMIAKEFGYQVASIVEELTTDKELCKRMGKTNYLIMKMMKMSRYALTIKLCDRYHNICDMKKMGKEFKEKYINETKEIIGSLEINRELTKTQKILVSMIKKQMKLK